jgi:phosphoglycolate phosphatase-like HAD superfamily hydrolase
MRTMTADTGRTGAVLIFDLDGTLFHTETVTVPAAREAFEAHGLAPPDDEAICSFIGRTSSEYNAWLRTLCRPAIAERIIETAARRELELIRGAGRLYPGIPEALAELRGTVAAMAVCSNGSRRYVEAVLASHEIAGFFSAVRSRRPRDRSKPQMVGDLLAQLVPAAAQREPPRGFVIGDRSDDVEAAHANGLRAIGCAYGYARSGELDGADAVAARPDEIPKLIHGLPNGTSG